MTGFLDPLAPSPRAEYARYIDGDLMGKLITKNLLINRLGYAPAEVVIPIGRYGDVDTRDPGDGHVFIGSQRVAFEVKCARINIANRYLDHTKENWAFANVLHSPGKAKKSYDVLIAIGINSRGLEDNSYWPHLKQVQDSLRENGYPWKKDARPYEAEFLSLCSFFIIPRQEQELSTNSFRINVNTVDKNKYAKYRAWGYDEERCQEVWNNALKALTVA